MADSPVRVSGIIRYIRNTVEPVVTRCILLGIFLLGLAAQIFNPIGDALQGSAFTAGALLSLVAYVLYDAIKDLADDPRGGQASTRFANPTSRADLIKESETGRAVDVRFLGYTGESIFDLMRGTLMRLYDSPGRVQSVTFRMLTPDLSNPMKIPSKLNSGETLSDDPEFRRYAEAKTEDYASHLLLFARRLRDRTQVQVSLQFRIYPGIPAFQVCLIGDNAAFFAFYDIARKTEFPYGRPDRILLDPLLSRGGRAGWDIRDGTQKSEHMVKECSDFFESLWKISDDAPWGEASNAP
ncbi:hypothetical protein [Streptomyces apricus]|uniref:Uncharacterized protein n=1 Tax=Streptomyces apricus TaxID=1828112 RepID=A0A5B0AKQ0_9ACTN|nr:hypothetical protein [Streptomyces apricus]KAA0929756.1 hypothetical protein FGF04_30625 [Streptomyces apricus]